MVKGGYAPGRTHPTDRARGQTTAMPAAVAASWQSHPDHPLVRLETAASGPGHAMSLQETPSDPCSTSATVILGSACSANIVAIACCVVQLIKIGATMTMHSRPLLTTIGCPKLILTVRWLMVRTVNHAYGSPAPPAYREHNNAETVSEIRGWSVGHVRNALTCL